MIDQYVFFSGLEYISIRFIYNVNIRAFHVVNGCKN